MFDSQPLAFLINYYYVDTSRTVYTDENDQSYASFELIYPKAGPHPAPLYLVIIVSDTDPDIIYTANDPTKYCINLPQVIKNLCSIS